MPGARRLWTGPHGSALRERVLEAAGEDPSGVWIVPCPLVRDQVLRALGSRHWVARGLRVWCWDDLWRAIVDERGGGPARLSAAAARAAVREAIARARRDGALGEVADVVDWPGFRRRLTARIAAWTRAGRSPEGVPPRGDDPAIAAQWAIFGRYRAVLRQLEAEDADGFAAWASNILRHDPPASWKRPGLVAFLDPLPEARAAWRALETIAGRARSVEVTLPFDPDPALAEVYLEATEVRRGLLEWGFAEVAVDPEIWRPRGLRDVEREVFRADSHGRPRLADGQGLTVLGAPQGEGTGLVIARQVKALLEAGTGPDDVLVLFRRWDDEAEVVLETLLGWGLPAAAERERPLGSLPAISALRLAMAVPVEDWEAGPLIRLLRNGQVRPAWPSAAAPFALATAAAAIRAARVFRGLDPLRRALDRAIGDGRAERLKVERARLAREVLDQLARLIEPLNQQSRPWRRQADQLRALAEGLGLGGPDDGSLDYLWDALDDHGAVLERLGRGGHRWTWAEFAREVEALVVDLALPAPELPPGVVRLAAVDDVAGARASWVVLANLGEGSFPTREAIDPRLALVPEAESPDEGPAPASLAFAREMLRFLRVVGSAETGLVLAYPTGDAQGQELLRAGFLDDVLGRFAPEIEADRGFHEKHPRFDPALTDRAELAGAPADARVRAVALACLRGDADGLAALARRAGHRRVLEGTAAALRVADSRLQSRRFDVYDGRLADPRAIARIAARYGPDYTFSPSQLESFLFCPFQFLLRYGLKLEPVDERDEIDDDYTERGSRVHRILEELERLLAQEPGSRLEVAERVILGEMSKDRDRGSDVDAGLDEIERRRLGRTIRRYVRQHDAYEALPDGLTPRPHLFEVVFGLEEDDPGSYPGLTLGEGDEAVRLQGKIDRIDLLPGASAEGPAFRVIDYKTGSCPSKKDVKDALYLQLPLYALAVERIVLGLDGGRLLDVGYWALAGDGFKSIRLKAWEDDRDALERYVTRVVGQLRRGTFVVDSCKDDCVQRCEYGAVCRVRQVRSAGKARDGVPTLELNV